MKQILIALLTLLFSVNLFAQQENLQKIYETEKSFEKTVAEKGINQGFLDFLTVDSVVFEPERANGVEIWKSRPKLPATLVWNPIWIDVSSNGAIGYSIGNSVYRANGKDDSQPVYGHYLSVWSRQPNGNYKATIDIGINHEKPQKEETNWKTFTKTTEKTETKISSADYSVQFFEMAEKRGLIKAYQEFLADDAYVLRENNQPFIGKKEALNFLGKNKNLIKFTKRTVFSGTSDLAYMTNSYTFKNKKGEDIEKGNFVQVWKLRNGKWQIVADVFLPSSLNIK